MALESILSKLPDTAATKKSIAVDVTEEEKGLFPDPENIVGPAMIEDGDFVLTSATAIARYLAKTTQAASLALLPTAAKDNAKCEALVELFHHTNIEEVVARVEKALEGANDYLCGSTFTIADALLAAKLKTAKASVSAKAAQWMTLSL
jgi:glutathione S-transferase